MKLTPFHSMHENLGAKMVEFAGFHMPIQYQGILAEHKRVRNTVGVFDVTHMGEFEVRGSGAFDFVQKMTTNDVTKLAEGKVQYSAMCYDDGGIVDDLLVYHCGDYIQLVVNASNLDKDFNWLSDHLEGDVQLLDRSDETALMAVQGPKSPDTLKKLTDIDFESLPYYHFTRCKVAGIDCLFSRTGYTGETGYELYFAADKALAERMWSAVFDAGKRYDIGPVGLGARDTLRLEVGFCLYGNDIDQTTNPLEANLGWITKIDKGAFIGRDALLKARETGIRRRLVGFLPEGRMIPRHGYDIAVDGAVAGKVTSGTMSPILDRPIAMGYVPAASAAPGSVISVIVRNQPVQATVTKVPFVTKK